MVVAELDEKPGLLVCDLDLSRLSIRDQIPVLKQKRDDLYLLEEVSHAALSK